MARLSEKLAQHAAKPSAAAHLNLSPKRDTLTQLALSQIEPDPEQPRKDLGDLSELSDSIRAMGVIQPIIVSIVGTDRYRILAGERRFSAAQIAGLRTIPAIVRSVEEHERLQLQIIENLHRKDLTPFEEARAYETLSHQFGLKQDDIARQLGRSQASVSETLRLLTLPEEIQSGFEQANHETGGKITRSLLLEIARQPAPAQRTLWEQARRGDLTVGKVRATKLSRPAVTPRTVPLSSGFRYPIHLEGVTVTLAFSQPKATFEDVVEALEMALAAERERIKR